MTVELRTYEELVRTLHLAAEIEHNLLCQYLFAAYSIKKTTAEDIGEVELELARGWEACITLVARQEMEHMGLVLNLLTAIGADPHIGRPNFPQAVSRYGGLGIASVLTRFSADTIARFQAFEAPHPTPDRFCAGLGVDRAEVRRRLLTEPTDPVLRAPAGDIPFTSVQDLYESLALGFQHVAASMGEPALFSGTFGREVWGGPGSPYYGGMDDLNQYGLDIIQVTGLESAIDAIQLILEQGEGIQAKPSYRQHVHYCLFTEILERMRTVNADVARPVVANPLVRMHPDITAPDEVTLLTDPATVEVADAFNQAYQLMLLMLVALYGDQANTPQQTAALMDAIFFPLMTMFVRPIAEVLTTLPAFADGTPGSAGPGFEIDGDLLADARTPGAFQARLDALARRLDTLALYTQRPPDDPAARRLRYLAVNAARLAEDWRTNWTDIGGAS